MILCPKHLREERYMTYLLMYGKDMRAIDQQKTSLLIQQLEEFATRWRAMYADEPLVQLYGYNPTSSDAFRHYIDTAIDYVQWLETQIGKDFVPPEDLKCGF